METAAVALLLGHDPLPAPLLELEGDDYLLACAVLDRAAQLHDERTAADLRALALNTGTATANAVAALLRGR